MRPSSSTAASAAPSGAARTIRDLLERAFTELARGEVAAASAASRTARILADAHDARALGMFARAALAIEEAIRGDIAGAERLTEDARTHGGEPSATATALAALRATIDATRSRSHADRGARRLAIDAWEEARAALRDVDADAARGLARTVVDLAAAIVAENDPRDLWIVGPKSFFVDTPNDGRIDLTKHPLPRHIWMMLVARHGSGDGIVTAAELTKALWPGADPASPTSRNRLKVTIWRTRDLGLRSAIVQVDGGYALAPDIRIRAWEPRDGRALIVKPG